VVSNIKLLCLEELQKLEDKKMDMFKAQKLRCQLVLAEECFKNNLGVNFQRQM